MMLRNAQIGFGQQIAPWEVPIIADGVYGVWWDLPDGLHFAFVAAENPGNGDVARMLDGLPRDRCVMFSVVISSKLVAMLTKRGFREETLHDPETQVVYTGMVRRPQPNFLTPETAEIRQNLSGDT